MQKRHTLQSAAACSEQAAVEKESNDSGTRLKRADDADEAPTGQAAKVVELSLPPAAPEPVASGKPPRWLAPIALALGIVCLALASWLQLH